MNRANPIENLIYLILTSVQVCFWSLSVTASPNLNPPSPSLSTESNTGSYDEIEASAPDRHELSKSSFDSLVISEADSATAPPPPSRSDFIPLLKPQRISLSTSFFSGPHQDKKSKLIYLFGMDYRHPINHSLWNHVGFSLGGGGTNPFLFISQEDYLRNYWKYLKSWHYLIQLELDHSQGFGSLFSWNHYMGGAGVSLALDDQLDLLLSIFPLSSRGGGIEIKINYLIF